MAVCARPELAARQKSNYREAGRAVCVSACAPPRMAKEGLQNRGGKITIMTASMFRKEGNVMFGSMKLTLLLLAATLAASAAVPRLRSVEPDALSPGAEAVAKGVNLDKSNVDKLFLTAGGNDVELEIKEQTADSITFTVPANTAKKRYRMMFLTTGDGAAYMEQPVSVEVMDEAAAKARAEESEAELEVVEAEPQEPEPAPNP